MKDGLQILNADPKSLNVLDVGCGVGRSTRLLLEFGVSPENIVGIDIRESAIELARRLNPGIEYICINRENDWPRLGRFDLCMQCTVFGSIKGRESRSYVADKMQTAIHGQGHIFWWDGIYANDFAGRDELDASSLFPRMRAELVRYLPLRPTLPEVDEGQHGIGKRIINFLQPLARVKTTHCFAVFGPPE